MDIDIGSDNELLCPPSTTDDNEACKLERMTADYHPLDERFITSKQGHQRQYAQLYFIRLQKLYGSIKQQVQSRWPKIPVVKILNISHDRCDDVVVIGTLYKEMKLKPSILQEYLKDKTLSKQLGATNFCSDNDGLLLEDESARMKLQGAEDVVEVDKLVTGIVVGVLGSYDPAGFFNVKSICFAGAASQVPRSPPANALEDKYLAIVSGLGVSNANQHPLRLDLLAEFLQGMLGGTAEIEKCSRIVRLVVAGGLLQGLDELATATPSSRDQRHALLPVKDMDVWLSEVAASLPVDVMPGAGDPANVALPQQPLHRCLFRVAADFNSMHRVTNPHDFSIDGVRVLGTSGQNVEDVSKYSTVTSPLDVMTNMLQYRHMAPTAPDTLTCHPFFDRDPFVIEDMPHVFFAANQRKYETEVFKGNTGQEVRLIAVPAFWKTGELVLLNLRTLVPEVLQFNTHL